MLTASLSIWITCRRGDSSRSIGSLVIETGRDGSRLPEPALERCELVVDLLPLGRRSLLALARGGLERACTLPGELSLLACGQLGLVGVAEVGDLARPRTRGSLWSRRTRGTCA